jgi:hypothetical protein
MDVSLTDPTGLGGLVAILVGLSLVLLLALALFSRARPAGGEPGRDRELDALLRRIGRDLRDLTSPARAGGLFYREAHEEVGRQLAELQARLRLLDDTARLPYEARAGKLLAAAARVGIILPPPESPYLLDSPLR